MRKTRKEAWTIPLPLSQSGSDSLSPLNSLVRISQAYFTTSCPLVEVFLQGSPLVAHSRTWKRALGAVRRLFPKNLIVQAQKLSFPLGLHRLILLLVGQMDFGLLRISAEVAGFKVHHLFWEAPHLEVLSLAVKMQMGCSGLIEQQHFQSSLKAAPSPSLRP